jgi:hypothetical protein
VASEIERTRDPSLEVPHPEARTRWPSWPER